MTESNSSSSSGRAGYLRRTLPERSELANAVLLGDLQRQQQHLYIRQQQQLYVREPQQLYIRLQQQLYMLLTLPGGI